MPVGCIHIGFVRERFHEGHRYLHRQVSYDHEPDLCRRRNALNRELLSVLAIIDMAEKMGLDVMSAGVALAWATEATGERESSRKRRPLVRLSFGDTEAYKQAMLHLGKGYQRFLRLPRTGHAEGGGAVWWKGLCLRPRPGDGRIRDRRGLLCIPGPRVSPFPPGQRRLFLRPKGNE